VRQRIKPLGNSSRNPRRFPTSIQSWQTRPLFPLCSWRTPFFSLISRLWHNDARQIGGDLVKPWGRDGYPRIPDGTGPRSIATGRSSMSSNSRDAKAAAVCLPHLLPPKASDARELAECSGQMRFPAPGTRRYMRY